MKTDTIYRPQKMMLSSSIRVKKSNVSDFLRLG